MVEFLFSSSSHSHSYTYTRMMLKNCISHSLFCVNLFEVNVGQRLLNWFLGFWRLINFLWTKDRITNYFSRLNCEKFMNRQSFSLLLRDKLDDYEKLLPFALFFYHRISFLSVEFYPSLSTIHTVHIFRRLRNCFQHKLTHKTSCSLVRLEKSAADAKNALKISLL